MRDSAMIALSDLVASTLGIAILLFIVALGNGLDRNQPSPKSQVTGDTIETAFKVFRGAPLSPQEMVETLYARTRGGRRGEATIDIFADRIVIVRHSEKTVDRGTIIMREKLTAGDTRAQIISRLSSERAELIVYIFSNEFLNVLDEYGVFSRSNVRFLIVPSALYRRELNGNVRWSGDFESLIDARVPYMEFRSRLIKILTNTGFPSVRPVKETDSLLGGHSQSYRPGFVFEKIKKGIENIIIFLLMGLSFAVIGLTERRP